MYINFTFCIVMFIFMPDLILGLIICKLSVALAYLVIRIIGNNCSDTLTAQCHMALWATRLSNVLFNEFYCSCSKHCQQLLDGPLTTANDYKGSTQINKLVLPYKV